MGRFAYEFPAYNYDQASMLPDEKVMELADQILNGLLVVWHEIRPMPYTIHNIDWNIQFPTSPNSAQMQLQSLMPILILCKAYLICNRIEYLHTAKRFVESWNDYSGKQDAEKNPYTWNDHAAAQRTENIIYYALISEKAGTLTEKEAQQLRSLLRVHAAFLYDDKNYTVQSNHGIFEDAALIYAAVFLACDESGAWLAHAKQRLAAQRCFAFTDEMVHVENSPQYHETVLKTFGTIAQFLTQFQDEDGETLYNDVIKSAEFLCWMVKPSGYFADIGDSDGQATADYTFNKHLMIFENEHLTYAAMRGTQGTAPTKAFAVYPQSGYYFSRSTWEREKFESATWFMFKAGYQSRVHKHADDLSILLYSRGYDVLVDGGKYNYMIGDSKCDYLHSAMGHNTITVDQKSYSITNERTHLAGISDFQTASNVRCVSGYNDAYLGVKIDRTVYQIGTDEFLLHDVIRADAAHIYSQMFHLSEHLRLLVQADDEVIAEIADTGFVFHIRQLNKPTNLTVYHGARERAPYGYRSAIINKTIDITTLRFECEAQDADFVTHICIRPKHSGNMRRPILDVCAMKVLTAFGEISLRKRKRIDTDRLRTMIGADKKLTLSYMGNASVIEDIVWQIYDKKWGKVIREQITQGTTAIFDLDFYVDVYVKALIRSTDRQIVKTFFSALHYDRSTGKFVEAVPDTKSFDLVINNQYIEREKERIRFYIGYQYFWNCRINWHLYKDGGHYMHKFTVDENVFECQLTVPGTYTMMYYISGPDGERQFYSFPEIWFPQG